MLAFGKFKIHGSLLITDDAPEKDDVDAEAAQQMKILELSDEEYTEDEDDYSDYEERDDVRKQCLNQPNRQVHFQDQQKVQKQLFVLSF